MKFNIKADNYYLSGYYKRPITDDFEINSTTENNEGYLEINKVHTFEWGKFLYMRRVFTISSVNQIVLEGANQETLNQLIYPVNCSKGGQKR